MPIGEIETSILEIILRKSLLEMSILIVGVKSLIFENFSWKLKFDFKVQKSYFGNHNLVLGNQKFHFDSQKVISKFSFSPLDMRRKNPIFCFGNQDLILLLLIIVLDLNVYNPGLF